MERQEGGGVKIVVRGMAVGGGAVVVIAAIGVSAVGGGTLAATVLEG